jgi:acetyl esterase/lipase
MIDTYRWILDQGVSSSGIIFTGDSAGGNLIALSLLQIRKEVPPLAMPTATVLMSPRVDMTAAQTTDFPNFHNNFMLNYEAGKPIVTTLCDLKSFRTILKR